MAIANLPGVFGATFASGVSNLYARYSSLRLDKSCDAFEIGYVLVFIDTEIIRADAPIGSTALASMIIRAAPPIALAPMWTRCQSSAKPSTE